MKKRYHYDSSTILKIHTGSKTESLIKYKTGLKKKNAAH